MPRNDHFAWQFGFYFFSTGKLIGFFVKNPDFFVHENLLLKSCPLMSPSDYNLDLIFQVISYTNTMG